MKLLILGKPFSGSWISNPKYRGVERNSLPLNIDHFASDHELQKAVNLRFDFAIEPGLGPLEDLQLTKYIANIFNKYSPDENFEIVELVLAGEKGECSGEFLGYDLAPYYGQSLIASYLDWQLTVNGEKQWTDEVKQSHPLMGLIVNHFSMFLNRNFLFDNERDATFCLNCMKALYAINNDYFCGYQLDLFLPVGIYVVPDESYPDLTK